MLLLRPSLQISLEFLLCFASSGNAESSGKKEMSPAEDKIDVVGMLSHFSHMA